MATKAAKKKYIEITAKFYVQSNKHDEVLDILRQLDDLCWKGNSDFKDAVEITAIKEK